MVSLFESSAFNHIPSETRKLLDGGSKGLASVWNDRRWRGRAHCPADNWDMSQIRKSASSALVVFLSQLEQAREQMSRASFTATSHSTQTSNCGLRFNYGNRIVCMTILQEEFLHQAPALIFTHHFHASKKNPVRVSLKKL